MKELVVKSNNEELLPSVKFNAESGEFFLGGISRIESINSFKEIFDWIEEYSKNPKEETVVTCDFTYMNSSTSKAILDLFFKIKELPKVKIIWNIDPRDIDMEDMGKMYSEILDIPLEIIYKN